MGRVVGEPSYTVVVSHVVPVVWSSPGVDYLEVFLPSVGDTYCTTDEPDRGTGSYLDSQVSGSSSRRSKVNRNRVVSRWPCSSRISCLGCHSYSGVTHGKT